MVRFRSERRRESAPLGSVLLGTPDEEAGIQRVRVQALATVLVVVTNAVGAVVVGALISVVIPGPNILAARFAAVFAVAPIYVGAAFVVGGVLATRTALRELAWAIENRRPTADDQLAALTMPWRLTKIQAVLWAGGAIVITTTVAFVDVSAIPKVAFTIAAGGATVCAFSYVLCEFVLRPVAAKALEIGDRREAKYAGMTSRSVLAWILGSAVPIGGLMIVAIFSFFRYATSNQLAVSILALGAIALLFGLLLITLSTRASVDPIRAVIAAMSAVEQGRTDAHVVVYDGTEVGQLQSGFNRMVDGLAERERIRDLFGRHVGHEVAEAALRRNPSLGGEELTIAVFFIDIVGSTRIAATRPPTEVVELLNRFFGVVVDEVDKNGGFINKFEGDGALAIFGAPAQLDDPAGSALAAARAIRRRLPDEVPDCRAAVGIAFGVAVAGNVGARDRFEYTVIGDPVNEAARLSEQAKDTEKLALASSDTVDAAGPDEGRHWKLDSEVTLRGRTAPTRLAAPAD